MAHQAMSGENRAELSALIVTPGSLEEIRPALAALRSQTARDRIEVVVVGPEGHSPDVEALAGFAAARVIGIGHLDSLGRAIATGMLAADAPIVAYVEEHSLPDPRWAEVVIERHRGPWAAVGWAIENANPGSAVSWAHMIADFGPGVAPIESGERHESLPWHHTSYKQDELIPYGDDLGELVEAEGLLLDDLLGRGRRLYMEGAVASRHINVSRSGANLRSHFLGGRGFGSARSRLGGWSIPRRVAYALAWPLVPWLRMMRLRSHVRRTRERRGRRLMLYPMLAIGLTADAFGEAVGYVAGEGGTRRARLEIELERRRQLRAVDQLAELNPDRRP
jgi:hypothetical protein